MALSLKEMGRKMKWGIDIRKPVLPALIICLLFFSCGKKPVPVFNRIEISYVDFLSNPFIDVGCGVFKENYSNTIKTMVITDSAFIAQVRRCIANYNGIALDKSMNVKVQIVLYKDATVQGTYCMDNRGRFMVNGKDIISNDCLFDLISQKTNKGTY